MHLCNGSSWPLAIDHSAADYLFIFINKIEELGARGRTHDLLRPNWVFEQQHR
jgi:hypothetical protein